MDPSQAPQPLRTANPANINRAERFEDEKRRIMSSCFSKKDDNGQLQQSYITHVRVEEDAAYPSDPPPANADPAYKKARVIIVAVKSSGRVLMHKARENQDTTFQIGKSWHLDELLGIESFSASVERSPHDAQRALLAGNSGFVITMTKPYYWSANTPKEKDFFIASLVKIFRKYTHGRLPQLVGFDAREYQELAGGASQPAPPPGAPQSQNLASYGASHDRPDARPGRASDHSADPSMRSSSAASSQPQQQQQQQRPPSPLRHRNIGSAGERLASPTHQPPQPDYSAGFAPARQGTPTQPRGRPSQDQQVRSVPSREYVNPTRLQTPPVTTAARLTPQSSHSNISAHSYEDSAGSRLASPGRSVDPPLMSPPHPQMSSRVINVASPTTESFPVTTPTNDRWRPADAPSRAVPDRESRPTESAKPNGSVSHQTKTSDSGVLNGSKQALPERRRPPLEESPHKETVSKMQNDPDNVPRPLRAKPQRPDAPSETPSQLDARIPGAFASPAPRNSPSPLTRSAETETPPPLSQHKTSTSSSAASNGQQPPPLKTDDLEPPPKLSDTPRTATPDSANEKSDDGSAPGARPGLGPMLAKKTLSPSGVSKNWQKAATAAKMGAMFKPRAGGAGERLLSSKTKNDNEPDGVTGVVPAPSVAKAASGDGVQPAPAASRASDQGKKQPSVDLKPSSAAPAASQSSVGGVSTLNVQGSKNRDIESAPPSPVPAQSTESMLKKRRSNQYNKYLQALDIDPLLLGSRGPKFETTMDDLGWSANMLQAKTLETLEADLRKDISRLEAGSWLGHTEQKDDRVEVFEKLLDRAIAECDEMEGLLTLYGVELSTLNEDIAYIEAQSHGLQVQTANQKLLQIELQNLVETVSIDSSQMSELQTASLSDLPGLDSVETCLVSLYKALNTIDPRVLQGKVSKVARKSPDSDLTGMRALQDKKELYLNEAFQFLDRMRHFFDPVFGAAFSKAKDAAGRNGMTQKDTKTLDVKYYNLTRNALWQYHPLMLFAKEIKPPAWRDMMRVYQARAKPVYTEAFRDSVMSWKRAARKIGAEDQDVLFTSLEKESEGITSTARKLTVKRSVTLARGLRSAASEKKVALERNPDNKLHPFEVFAGILEEVVPIMYMEQNFIVEFFHATSGEDGDFLDAVTVDLDSRQRDIQSPKGGESDPRMAKAVNDAMADIFQSWPREMSSLLEWGVASSELQGIGILCALERQRREIDQASQLFIDSALQKVQEQLGNKFLKSVDMQVHAIEDTKVKIKKRKGVIGFIKLFPNFSAVIENMLPPADGPEQLTIRSLVDGAYERINKAMFDSLKAIAKENPMGPGQAGLLAVNTQSMDPDDKEALNYHISLIENMHHYVSEVEEHGDAVLAQWRGKAMMEMAEHRELYVSAVIRRPIGKLLDFVESTETLLLSGISREAPSNLPNSHPSHSRSVFKKVMSSHHAKDVRKGVEALKARVEKHFGDADEPGLSHKLVSNILDECERKFVDVHDRATRIARDVYEGSVEVEFSRQDIQAAFRRP